MEQLKQTDEEFVRSVWNSVDDFGGRMSPVRLFLPRETIHKRTWVSAAAFTHERLEEVRHLREEIAQQTELIDGTNPGPIIEDTEPLVRQCSILPESWRDGLQRTLSRLESILADKTAGMKAGA